VTDVETMAQYIMIAESANQKFTDRQEAIDSARALHKRAKKSYAYYGLTNESFDKLEALLDSQMSDMDGQGIDPDVYTYAEFSAEITKRHKEAKERAAASVVRPPIVQELPDTRRRKRWWQFWRR
jgi:hypothetical protein